MFITLAYDLKFSDAPDIWITTGTISMNFYPVLEQRLQATENLKNVYRTICSNYLYDQTVIHCSSTTDRVNPGFTINKGQTFDCLLYLLKKTF